MSHRNDSCRARPPADAEMLKRRLTKTSKTEVALLDGGDPPESPPCETKAAHGYFGIEAKAVDTIADFIDRSSNRPRLLWNGHHTLIVAPRMTADGPKPNNTNDHGHVSGQL